MIEDKTGDRTGDDPTPLGPAEVIRVEGVSKLYRRTLPGDRLRTLKSALVGRSLASGLKPEESIAALETVDFAVHHGEAFGVIGGNGSGKSTLLKLVAGMLKPTTGRITVAGRVAALIELGAGFHPEISGRENVFINGAVLGLSRRQRWAKASSPTASTSSTSSTSGSVLTATAKPRRTYIPEE